VKVDIWSDVQCPWCFIGKRKFEAAVEQFGEPVEVEFHSFLLNPEAEVDFPGSTADYLSQKLGLPVEKVADMHERVSAIAASVGLNYDFVNQIQTNTTKAHELLHFAKTVGKQVELKERLMAAHFEEGKHVGRLADLADLAAEVGIDREAALQALESGKYSSAVTADIDQARAYGITGVPFFVIDGKFGLSGAQDSSTFLEVLKKAANEL
jgi:predicted DsbA family dithiol-disulfide isomerase